MLTRILQKASEGLASLSRARQALPKLAHGLCAGEQRAARREGGHHPLTDGRAAPALLTTEG